MVRLAGGDLQQKFRTFGQGFHPDASGRRTKGADSKAEIPDGPNASRYPGEGCFDQRLYIRGMMVEIEQGSCSGSKAEENDCEADEQDSLCL